MQNIYIIELAINVQAKKLRRLKRLKLQKLKFASYKTWVTF